MTQRAWERFEAWTTNSPLSIGQIACALGCHASHVSHLRAGRKVPGRRLAAAIEAATANWDQGTIKVGEWDADLADVREAA